MSLQVYDTIKLVDQISTGTYHLPYTCFHDKKINPFSYSTTLHLPVVLMRCTLEGGGDCQLWRGGGGGGAAQAQEPCLHCQRLQAGPSRKVPEFHS